MTRTLAYPMDRRLFMAGVAVGGLTASGAAQAQAAATTVFHGGPIRTMDDAQPSAEAVAVRGQTILAVGALDAVRAAAGRGARLVDLDGRALLPGFFDPHGHVSMVGLQARYANLLPAPDGEGNDIAALQRITRDWMNRHEALVRDMAQQLDDLNKDRKAVARDLKPVYRAVNVEAAEQALSTPVVPADASASRLDEVGVHSGTAPRPPVSQRASAP